MATFNGTNHDDQITGTASADTINGYAGDDTLVGLAGNDSIYGGDGADFLFGDDVPGNPALGGDDRLSGGANNDTLIGGPGFDELLGGSGNDDIRDFAGGGKAYGGSGNDALNVTRGEAHGGDGTDDFVTTPGVPMGRVTWTGDRGTDYFGADLYAHDGAAERITITDFHAGEDILRMSVDDGGVTIGSHAFGAMLDTNHDQHITAADGRVTQDGTSLVIGYAEDSVVLAHMASIDLMMFG